MEFRGPESVRNCKQYGCGNFNQWILNANMFVAISTLASKTYPANYRNQVIPRKYVLAPRAHRPPIQNRIILSPVLRSSFYVLRSLPLLVHPPNKGIHKAPQTKSQNSQSNYYHYHNTTTQNPIQKRPDL